MLTLTNVQITNDGVYTVVVSNGVASTISSNAFLMVDYSPGITGQPVNQEVAQGANVLFTVGTSGTGPLSYQWYFNGVAMAQGTNAALTLNNVQATNGGSYDVVVSNPFGSATSTNASLTVDEVPVILTQPQNQAVLPGTSVAFSVGTAAMLPTVSSGTLELWLRADVGVITNSSGLVSQWQDQSGNANNALQTNTSLQPLLVSPAALGNEAAVRFNGIQNNTSGSYMFGAGSVGVPTAMTAFTIYNAFSATNAENVIWDIGQPGLPGQDRGAMITDNDLHFTFWSLDYSAPFIVPTNTYRIRTDRLDTNLNSLNMFDYSINNSTNFSLAVAGPGTPGAGYYLGGLNSSLANVGSSRNFDGDIAEMICYQGYLSEPDRLAVTSYLKQKYFQTYQWQLNGTNIPGATNAMLTLTNVQITNDGVYTVVVSNGVASTISSNAFLMVGYSPGITGQPVNQEVAQGANVLFTVGTSGTGPPSYQWYFNGVAMAQGTNAALTLNNVQATNGGSYDVVVSNPFGSATSTNASLTVDEVPVILTQPQNQAVLPGTSVAFSVGTAAMLPTVSSGTLELWLRADVGVITNSSGLVSQWQDQSGNANNALQTNTSLQPLLVSPAALGNEAAVRFNGIQNNTSGSYMFGAGSVGVPTAMTAFTIYNAFSATNAENVIWDIGVPGQYGLNRGAMIASGLLHFTFWAQDYSAVFTVPTNTYRIRIDRLDTNLDTLNMFDETVGSSTNFTLPVYNAGQVSGPAAPNSGYYLGGLNSSVQNNVGSSRNFGGDIAEMICYQGYLSEPDRLVVTSYLKQKYFQTYQWQLNGTNIPGATNATLIVPNAQTANVGTYMVIVSNGVASTVSSNAVLMEGYPPVISNQPVNQEVAQGANVSFTVGASGVGPLSYQWYFNGVAMAQGTNAALTLNNVQATNGGSYDVVVSNPFGSATSTNASLTVDEVPVILTQPQNQAVLPGTSVAFSVGTAAMLPTVSSGTLELWLRADVGVITNSSGLVSQWQDQSGNANNALQTNTSLQPLLVSPAALGNEAAVRFNGIQNNTSGSYMFGAGSVGVPTAMTAFTIYNAFSATNAENVIWDIGVPGQYGLNRGAMIASGLLHFTFWAQDYSAVFTVPTNTYRIRIDRLDTNLDTLNMFDETVGSSTNFTLPVYNAGQVSGPAAPNSGYYLGGLNSSVQNNVGSSRNFGGDIAEMICYQGYLSEPDRLVVTSYLKQKYFQTYQWQLNGTNIPGATNATLVVTNVQITNNGIYAVIVSNGVASTISSNAILEPV